MFSLKVNVFVGGGLDDLADKTLSETLPSLLKQMR